MLANHILRTVVLTSAICIGGLRFGSLKFLILSCQCSHLRRFAARVSLSRQQTLQPFAASCLQAVVIVDRALICVHAATQHFVQRDSPA